jgi:predicted Zn finger-like uncharacterized protein
VRIQCERCATTYELDETRLPPHGGMVKCTRCQHVFRAAPPGLGTSSAEAPRATAPAAAPGNGVDAGALEKTAVFGFAAGGDPEGTASLGSAAPAPTAAPAEAKGSRPAAPAGAQPGQGPVPGRGRRWQWVALGLAVAAVIALLLLR